MEYKLRGSYLEGSNQVVLMPSGTTRIFSARTPDSMNERLDHSLGTQTSFKELHLRVYRKGQGPWVLALLHVRGS